MHGFNKVNKTNAKEDVANFDIPKKQNIITNQWSIFNFGNVILFPRLRECTIARFEFLPIKFLNFEINGMEEMFVPIMNIAHSRFVHNTHNKRSGMRKCWGWDLDLQAFLQIAILNIIKYK